ncbi:MAG: AIPR protein, partial [FCB group bacterium]|nr:AIPR protein [FCB group bacterium]
MSSNQQIVLNTILEQKRKEMDETLPESFFFNLFVVDQVLKDYELSYDEINEGIVEGGCDGGIDALYTFVNGDLIQRDSDLIDVKRNAKIELFIIQSKSQTGFGETPIEKCNSSAIDLFNLGNELDGLRAVYNNNLLTNIGVFRNQYLKTISKFPVIEINYIYASKGIEVHNNVKRKVAILENTVKGQFSSAMFSFEFLTADRLLELNRKDKIESKGMLLKDNPISTQDGGYIALVPIKSFLDFISDENGDIINTK